MVLRWRWDVALIRICSRIKTSPMFRLGWWRRLFTMFDGLWRWRRCRIVGQRGIFCRLVIGFGSISRYVAVVACHCRLVIGSGSVPCCVAVVACHCRPRTHVCRRCRVPGLAVVICRIFNGNVLQLLHNMTHSIVMRRRCPGCLGCLRSTEDLHLLFM